MTSITIAAPLGAAADSTRQGRIGDWSLAVGRGLALGVTLGATYRAWMRLVTTDPDFSWSGTLFIVGLCTVAALLASLSLTARQRWSRRWAKGVIRVVASLGVLLLAAGPGMIAVIVWLPAALALGRVRWHRWLRRGLWTVATAGFVVFLVVVSEDFSDLGVVRVALAIPGFLAIQAVVATLFTWPTGTRPAR